MEETYGRYFEAVSAPDPARAVEVLDQALTRGVPPASLITDVLARAQRTAGEKWMNGEWTIADEHAATAVAKQALTLVAPPSSPPRAGVHVVVACAEGEWHSLPARMAGELLRGADLEVSILGASIPADQLREHLRSTLPDVLALSATVSTSLIGAALSIEAARAEGIAVVVGGAAWGVGQRRARALGAHLRLDDIRDIRSRLEEIRAMTAPALSEIPAEARWLDQIPRHVVESVMDQQWADDVRWAAARDDGQRTDSQRDLGWMARHAAAAVACDDPSVVADLLDWLLWMHVERAQPLAPILDRAHHLADAIENQAPRAATILRREADAARERIARDGAAPWSRGAPGVLAEDRSVRTVGPGAA